MHWIEVLVLPECEFEYWPVAALVSLSKTLNHNCFVLRMGRKAVGPVCYVMHVKEPRTLIVKEKGLAPMFLDSHLEHPAGYALQIFSLLLLLYLIDGQFSDVVAEHVIPEVQAFTRGPSGGFVHPTDHDGVVTGLVWGTGLQIHVVTCTKCGKKY